MGTHKKVNVVEGQGIEVGLVLREVAEGQQEFINGFVHQAKEHELFT